jgi:hypothetical protein
MIYIQFPSGSHGHFLKLLINRLAGVGAGCVDGVYHRAVYSSDCVCDTRHFVDPDCDPSRIVNIVVKPDSYLKFFTMCVTRTANLNIELDTLHINTVQKVRTHPILNNFLLSLETIADTTTGNVEPCYIREWVRLCFFNNNTIDKFISVNNHKDAIYNVDFEAFYDNSIVDVAIDICNHFKLPVALTDEIYNDLAKFRTDNRYFFTDHKVAKILNAIDTCTEMEFQTNLIEQAWIDNYLQIKYNKDPLLVNSYFTNVKEITNAYNIG